ncbi:hypothetical protein SDRG_08846 [Saprolegnia diclina VS20]|uniref:F-box domain-containing protein n=1 Tax=Saprolegnia diclina (strain VS20) TaxID=1156394 RepID=T0Q789_SAPDV|nr:hypothetical protein SDRG_08846 [Saprolegnia diclina VS20]EQC33744.1 hypothetical protein SDRG_08846 [Saprolegnia diclina VS20]|eukprot:XP_008612967.1 hypothetical protein SDRG_08846 [Saprolegnia diclina VS20]
MSSHQVAMAEAGRQQKAGRPTPPPALALPQVIEAIATCLYYVDDSDNFLHAVSRCVWAPALTAFYELRITPSVTAEWPLLYLDAMEASREVLALVAATLPLRPCVVIPDAIWQLASLVKVAPILAGLSRVTLDDLLLQRCPFLHDININVEALHAMADAELNDLLAVFAHPRLRWMRIDLLNARIITPQFGQRLITWLRTVPATKTYLSLTNVAHWDRATVLAFCDALQANTSLCCLSISNVVGLGGFHGRCFPTSLKVFSWSCHGDVDDATIQDVATALGPTKLERLCSSAFGQLTRCSATAQQLATLQHLSVYRLSVQKMNELVAVPALTSLKLDACDVSSVAEHLMETLATTCVHLEKLLIPEHPLTRDGVTTIFVGALRLPQLTSLSLSMRLPDVLYALPELVDVGRHVPDLYLVSSTPNQESEAHEGKRASYLASAVAAALGPRADRDHRCRLLL